MKLWSEVIFKLFQRLTHKVRVVLEVLVAELVLADQGANLQVVGPREETRNRLKITTINLVHFTYFSSTSPLPATFKVSQWPLKRRLHSKPSSAIGE